MAWTPPVSLPNVGGRNYAGQLFGMLAAPGEAYYQGRRDKVADAQWAAEQQRLQTQSDRDYAMELRRLEQGAENGYGLNPIWGYNEATDSYGVFQPSKSGAAPRQMEFPEGFNPMPPAVTDDYGGYKQLRDKFGRPIRNTTMTGDVDTDFNVTDIDPVTGAPLAVEPRPGSKPAMDAAAAQQERIQNQNKAQSALYQLESQTDFVNQTIDSAIQNVSQWTTGYGGLLANLPETEARNLHNQLLTIRSNIGLGNLQELKASGATLGQVTIFENLMLQAVDGALDQLSRGEDITAALQDIKRIRGAAVVAARIGFMADYQGLDANDAAGAFDALARGADPAMILNEIQRTYGG